MRSPYCQLIVRMIFNILHIICRGAVLALLASYLHYLSLAFIGAMIICNYIISNIIVKTDGSKHFWTAFAAVLLPNCFISRDTVETIEQQVRGESQNISNTAGFIIYLLCRRRGESLKHFTKSTLFCFSFWWEWELSSRQTVSSSWPTSSSSTAPTYPSSPTTRTRIVLRAVPLRTPTLRGFSLLTAASWSSAVPGCSGSASSRSLLSLLRRAFSARTTSQCPDCDRQHLYQYWTSAL